MWEEREKRSKEWKTKLLRSSAEDIVKWRLAANILCYVIEKCWKYKRGGRLQFGKTYKHLNFLNMDNFVSSPKHSGSEGRHLIKKTKKTFPEAPFLGFLRLPSKYYWGCVFFPLHSAMTVTQKHNATPFCRWPSSPREWKSGRIH